MLLVAGDWLSSMPTAVAVCVESASQISETSSSVGPIPLGFAGDSENGSRFSRIVAGDVVIGSSGVVEMPRYRAESIGLWPCLAEMMISVELYKPRALSAATILPIELSANSISPSSAGRRSCRYPSR